MSPAAMIDSKLSFSVAGSADIAMREARVIVVTESCGKVHARHEDTIRMAGSIFSWLPTAELSQHGFSDNH
jgi:hypothetical protein